MWFSDYLIKDKYSKNKCEKIIYGQLNRYTDEQNVIKHLAQEISDEIDKEILRKMKEMM